MPNNCKICSHEDRAEIENAILNATCAPERVTLEKIAEDFYVDVADLKAHALFHLPATEVSQYESALDCADIPEASGMELQHSAESSATPRDSLSRKMKLREADMLAAVSNEYLVTLKSMGRRINSLAKTSTIDIEDQDNQVKLARLLTKPMVDLYIGLGGEIRQNVKAMADLDRQLNGPEDTSTSGLVALANAISGSRAQSNTQDDFPQDAWLRDAEGREFRGGL